ncbi:hypothetical protein MSG28_004056 [Choristoneura fumiferana]|uniref:Uncharacterized protein n=1 Tax=Choristoneura fumiferana TaxID=7141 RepID=A0ACC0KHY3_CHOFU|nr:hypothetical protein MSG28_004056 [Choristoneura fumiferana]
MTAVRRRQGIWSGPAAGAAAKRARGMFGGGAGVSEWPLAASSPPAHWRPGCLRASSLLLNSLPLFVCGKENKRSYRLARGVLKAESELSEGEAGVAGVAGDAALASIESSVHDVVVSSLTESTPSDAAANNADAVAVPTPFKLLSAVIADSMLGSLRNAFLVSAITARGVFTLMRSGDSITLEEQITVGGEKSSSGDHEPEDDALAGLPPGMGGRMRVS